METLFFWALRPLFLLLLFALPLVAAEPRLAENVLNVKSNYAVGEPIQIGCTCAPAPGVSIRVTWKLDSGVSVKDATPDGLNLYAWATPGKHSVVASLVLLKTEKIKVFVPDPDNPTDITKAKLAEYEIFKGFDTQELSGEFTQAGSLPPPPDTKVAVPDVVGLSYSKANDALADAGLDTNLNGPATGTVTRQSPVAGSLVLAGSTIEVFTSATPPQPVPTGIKAAVIIYEFSKLPAPKAAGDLAVEEYLNAQCGSNWRRWDDDPGNLTNPPANLADLWAVGRSARSASGKGDDDPWIEIETKDGKKFGRSLDDNTLQFLKSYGG